MAAVIARAGLDVAADRALGHYTHEKSPLGCAAALATLEVIEQERLLARAETLGAHALLRMKDMQQRQPLIGDVRGIGLLLGIELNHPRSGEPARDEAEQVMYRCLSRGLSFKLGQGNVLTLSPPLIIAGEELEHALGIIETAIGEVAASL
jgi:4-aminobutyrate aminotransferase